MTMSPMVVMFIAVYALIYFGARGFYTLSDEIKSRLHCTLKASKKNNALAEQLNELEK